MLLIVVFIFSATCYSIADSLYGMFAIMFLLGVVLSPFVLGFMWLNDQAGMNHLLIESWQEISGAHDTGELTSCQHYNDGLNGPNGLILVMFPLVLINVPITAAAIFLPLIGFVTALFGTFEVAVSHGAKHEALKTGVTVMVIGFGAILLSGLMFRLMHMLVVPMCT